MTSEEKQGALEIIKKFAYDMHELTGSYPNEIKLEVTSYNMLADEIDSLFRCTASACADLNCFTLFGTNIKRVGFVK